LLRLINDINLAKDAFGTTLIYVPQKNHVPFVMDEKNFDNQSRVDVGGDTGGFDKVSGSGDFWECQNNSKVRMSAFTVKGADYKDTCKLDFAKAEKEGNIGLTDVWDDFEMTIKVNLTSFSPSDGRVILKGPTAQHHSNTVCCSGACYGIRFFCNGNPMKVEFFKEIWHVNYDSRNSITTKFGNLNDGNDHMLKFVKYNIVENGKTAVKLEAYFNDAGDGVKFVKVAETVDSGGWGSDGGVCNGDDDQIISWGSIKAMYRWDASSTDIKFNHITVYNIDPTASDDQEPPPSGGGGGTPVPRPTTTRLVIPIVLSFDVNAYRFSKCAVVGGAPVSADPFYSNTFDTSKVKELCDDSFFSNRKRLCVNIVDTGSVWYNKTVKQFKCWLRKHNVPATKNINAKIWESGTGTVIKYTSPTVFADSALTTSFVLYTFDFSTNTYVLKVGDRIGVEYLGTNVGSYVEGSYVSDIPNNGTNMNQYEKTTWQVKATRELACEGYI
jgi:hypothetical protein